VDSRQRRYIFHEFYKTRLQGRTDPERLTSATDLIGPCVQTRRRGGTAPLRRLMERTSEADVWKLALLQPGLDLVPRENECSTQLQMCQHTNWIRADDPAMFEDLLKLGGRVRIPVRSRESLAAHIRLVCGASRDKATSDKSQPRAFQRLTEIAGGTRASHRTGCLGFLQSARPYGSTVRKPGMQNAGMKFYFSIVTGGPAVRGVVGAVA
jgi:hypothetical protein